MLRAIDVKDKDALKEYLGSRTDDINGEIILKVTEILNDVKINKDAAVKKYTEKFDKVALKALRVSDEDIDKAAKKADPFFIKSMEEAKKNIEFFHKAQKQNGYILEKEMGIYLGQRVLPLDSVGIYVPGGRAQYPSSVLMNVIPAKIAGVKRIVMITPPSKEMGLHPNIAAAAKIAGVNEIYTVGGAQGIAALAYGTESIEKVDKIVGPGNIFVATAWSSGSAATVPTFSGDSLRKIISAPTRASRCLPSANGG